MTSWPHSIRQQQIEIAVASQELALSLQPRFEEINRRRWLPLIERVFDELAPEDHVVRLERLDLDLGLVDPAQLGREVEQRLEHTLREALTRALAAPSDSEAFLGAAPPRASQTSEGQARRQLVRHELRTGNLPFWAPTDSRRGLQERLLELVSSEPHEITDLLRGEARRSATVIERLARQLDDDALQKLVHLLEPEHGALIVAYLANLRQAHRLRRLLPRGDRELAHSLWVLVQAYLLLEAGSRFNRRSFLAALLRRLAHGHGQTYSQLLATLAAGLELLARQRPIESSLPALVGELVAEDRAREGAVEDPAEGVPPGSPEGRQPEGRSGAASADSAAVDWSTARYELVELLRAFSRRGLPPWELLLENPDWTAEGALSALTGLPRSLLSAAFTDARGEVRPEALWRALRVVPVERCVALLLRLLPAARGPASPFRGALEETLAGAEEPRRVVAAIVAAVLAGRDLDLAALAHQAAALKHEPAVLLPPDLSAGDTATLAAALVHRLRWRDDSPVKPSPADLLVALADRDPAATGDLLRNLLATPALAAALERSLSEDRAQQLLPSLASTQAPTWRALWSTLAEIPSPYRPRPGLILRQLALHGGRRLAASGTAVEDRFEAVLRALFTWPLAEPIRRFLLRRARSWPTSGEVPTVHFEAFERAVTTASGAPPEGRAATSEGTPGSLAEERSRRRSRVLAILAGDDLDLDARRFDGALADLLAEPSRELRELLSAAADDEDLRRRWARTLPEPALARLTAHLTFGRGSRRHRELLDTAEILSSAWQQAAGKGTPSPADRGAFWLFLLDHLATGGAEDVSVARLVSAFFARFVTAPRGNGKGRRGEDRSFGRRLIESAEGLALAAGHGTLRAVLLQEGDSLLASPRAPSRQTAASAPPGSNGPSPTATTEEARGSKSPAGSDSPAPSGSARLSAGTPPTTPERPRKRAAGRSRPQPPDHRQPSSGQPRSGKPLSGEPLAGEPHYIENAGLVLISPFLPHLFSSLDYLQEDDEGTPRMGRGSRAVHLLQWLADGRCDAAEPELLLNKILCGLAVDEPVERRVELTAEELALGEKLLEAVRARWTIIHDSSIAALRETFLQRQGRLLAGDEGWQLVVDRKTLDVLVDQIPWGFSVTYHRWMKRALYATW